MTLPPCKPDGIDCPRRYIGCRAECEAWHEWLCVHEKEVEARRHEKDRLYDADAFLVNQGKRTRRNNQLKRMIEKERGIRKL